MAGLGAKLFASFTKLTAADVNGYLADQSIMRFATSTARDAAFGGAGEPTLAEGMTCYLDDTNQIQSYTGSAWVGVAASSTVADVSSGLVFIKTQTFTNDSPLITDVFSTNYEHYVAILRCTSSIAGQYTNAQLINASTPKTTNYNRGGLVATSGAVLSTDSSSTGQDGWRIAGQSTTGIYATMTFFRPFSTAETGYFVQSSYAGNLYSHAGAQTESYSATGFKILASGNAATFTGTVSVYGYR
jgi:hypothetical protein